MAAPSTTEQVDVLYRSLVDSSNDAILSIDMNGIVTSWNKSAEYIFGYSASEVIGKSIRLLLPEDRILEQNFIFEKLQAGERIQHFETWRVRKDGALVPVSLTISPMYDSSGGVIGASKIARDIAERLKAEAALATSRRQSEELLAILETLLRSAPVYFAFLDQDCRYVRINEALAALHGRTVEDHLGRTIEEILPESWQAIQPIFQSILDGGPPSVGREVQIRHAATGDDRLLVANHYPVCINGEVIGVGVVAFDLTEQRRAEQRLRRAERLEAIGTLTGGIAHDFNNMLGIVILNLQLARDHAATGAQDELATDIQEALESAWHGSELTKSLLAFARRQPLQPVATDVNRLVSNTVRLLQRLLGEDVEVQLELAAGLPAVLVDPGRLEASLTNLAANARAAMPQGGRLIITTSTRDFDADYPIGQSEILPGSYVVIEVSDTGVGMPAEVLARIFEPFFTTRSPGEGSGLGLSMVFGFAKQSGGHISAYSEVGIGTTFRLYLPTTTRKPVQADIPGKRAPRGGTERVLVVEDNEPVRRIVVRQLRELGYEVFEAANGNVALERLQAGDIDLLFTDIIMPGGLDGGELARMALERYPNLKVLLTSGFPEACLRTNIHFSERFRLLSKPYPTEELALAIRGTLDG